MSILRQARPPARPTGWRPRWWRQPGRGPIAGEPEIGVARGRPRPPALLGGQRRERRPPFADDLPWWHGGRIARTTAATSSQIVLASASRGVSTRRSAPLIVTDSRSGEGENPFRRAADHADDRRQCRAAAQREKCALTMARNSSGASRPGSNAAATTGGTARITPSSAPERHLSSPKSSAGTRSPFATSSARSRRPEPDGDAVGREASERRRDEVGPSPSRAISGRQARPPAATSPAAPRGERRRALGRRGVERGEQQRPDQAVVQRAFAGDQLADRRIARRPQQAAERQVIARRRSRHATGGIEDPPRDAAVADPQRPARAAREIDEGKIRVRRTDQLVARADDAQKVERRVVRRQQQVIAVVDLHVEGGIVVRAAAPARLPGRLVHDDLAVRPASAEWRPTARRDPRR